MKIELSGSSLRWLSWDIEARPLTWLGGDRVSREITAIGWKWVGSTEQPTVVLLGELTGKEMLLHFLEYYRAADGLTGHYLRGYDLPTLNSALIEHGIGKLPAKLSHDTCLDLPKMPGLSKSQENLAALFGVRSPKIRMTDPDWREANRLRPEGLKKTAKRVAGDVIQQIELREVLMKKGLLGKPKVWSPRGK